MILDTNALSALFSGDWALAQLLASEARHHVPTIVLGEYRYGLERSSQRELLGSLLDELTVESIVLTIDERTAHLYASVRERLRRAGTPIPENDVWIAALARQHSLPIVSRDQHFDRVQEVVRREW